MAKVKIALIGLGKMGISHLAILRAHPDVDLVAVCDPQGFVLDGLSKYTGLKTYRQFTDLLANETLDGVVVATPSRFHDDIVRAALEQDLAVFCEKPFSLDAKVALELAELAEARGLINHVGYHYRHVAAFREAKRLLDSGVIGKVHHLRAEAYGPVVLRPKGSTWRSKKNEGGGCLYDYASHAIDLSGYFLGAASHVSGSVLRSVFSEGVDDEVYSTLHYEGGVSAQLAANWSDESHRKMSVKMKLWGTGGSIEADRQEVRIFVRDARVAQANGLRQGWNVRNTTELTEEVWFYLRGEEYSAQIDRFVTAVATGAGENVSTFRTAAQTDRVIDMIVDDASGRPGAMPQQVKRPNRAIDRLFAIFEPKGA